MYNTLEIHFKKIFSILALPAFSFLLICGLYVTGVNSSDLADEHIILMRGSFINKILGLTAVIVFVFIVYKVLDRLRISQRDLNYISVIFTLISGLIAVYFVTHSYTVPQGDQDLIIMYAKQFNSGDFSGLKKGEYMSFNPQQLGIVTFLRILFHLFGDGNYRAFQILQALLFPVLVYTGYLITKEISQFNINACLSFLIFSITVVPIYVYTCFVYGDFISLPFLMVGMYLILKCLKQFNICMLIVASISLGLSTMLKHNILVSIISIIITCFIKALSSKSFKPLVIILFVVFGVWGFNFGINKIYENQKDPESVALPATSYIVMGLNDDNGNAGWFNGYNQNIGYETNFNEDKMNKVIKKDFNNRINEFVSNPSYTIDFYYRKINMQWNSPMFQAIVMNHQIWGGKQPLLIYSLFNHGIVYALSQKYMKLIQLFAYFCSIIFLIYNFNSKVEIEKYMLMIAVYGGFLFTLIWEAKARYVFPYFFLLLPYLSTGLNYFNGRLEEVVYRIQSLIRRS